MVEAGIDNVSVFIPSANPNQYKLFMNAPLSAPCTFLGLCQDKDLKTRVVTVARPDIDPLEVRKLGEALGAVEFEAKKYIPNE